MGFKNKLQSRKESIAFKKIVEKQNLQARRKAYAEESLVKAREEGKARARKKSTGQALGSAFQGAVQRAITPPKKSNPVSRRTTVKRPSVKKPVRKTYSKKPVTRTRTVYVEKRPIEKAFNPFDQKITY